MTLSLLEKIPAEAAEVYRSIVARWTEVPESGWDPEPAYGAFIDDQGRVVTGTRPPRAFLNSDDPRTLVLSPEVEASLESQAVVVFIDWGRQPLAWEEIFDLWAAWEAQGMILDCGPVGVPWHLASRWTFPGWIAFRDGFDGAPLSVQTQGVSPLGSEPGSTAVEEVEPDSFLARAQRLRGEAPLPMIPFTLTSLGDPAHLWPSGAFSIGHP